MDTRSRICRDLFSGLGGFSQAFKDRGWSVVTVDIDERFNPNLCADIMDVDPKRLPQNPDIILISPPCNCFSVASIRWHWTKHDNGTITPNDSAKEAIKLVDKALWLKDQLNPRFWVLENPTGMMRRVLGSPYIKTSFAAWGNKNLKPTDLWGNLPFMVFPIATEWEKAPRGSRKGTQGIKDPAERAKIPYGLSLALCRAVEDALND